MELLLGALFLAWLISSAVKNGKLDHEYAKQGMVSPRLSAKYGGDAEARAKVAKYGLFDHIRDAWRDGWARRTDAMIAARDAKATRAKDEGWWVWLRRRRDAAIAAANDDLEDHDDVVPAGTRPAAPVDDTTPDPVADPDPPAVSDPPTPAPEPDQSDPAEPAPPTPQPSTSPTAPPSTEGEQQPMSTSTGEVVNYETALAEIDNMIQATQQQIDSANAALTSMTDAKARVDEMQQTYVGDAAANKLDHEAALNLDGTTLTHASTAVDALPVGAVDALFTQVEEVEVLTRQRLEQAELALASLQAEREHLIATYGDAHDIVSSNLSGDSRFLASDGGATTSGATAAAPAQATAEPARDPAAANAA